MNQAYVAIIGGAVLLVLGLASVFRPKQFWGTDLDQVAGKNVEARKRLIRRRWQVGTVGFLATGVAFIGAGIWMLLS